LPLDDALGSYQHHDVRTQFTFDATIQAP
jgi:hypothetical protein